MIYAHEPILNDDIKQSKPSTYYVIEEALKRLKLITVNYTIMNKLGLFNEELTKYNTLWDEINNAFEQTKTLEENFKTSGSADDKKLFKESLRSLKKTYTINKSLIVPRKVLKAAEVFVTTVNRWSQGNNTNHKTTLLIWLLTSVLRF